MEYQRLHRELGIWGATATGLGSILGTGAFVGIAVASSIWGDSILWAIPLAAAVALCSGLSTAFLAGRFPVAGGTYEYAYETLNPWFGFTAGWVFLLAKTASAATAALGASLYLGWDGWIPPLVLVVVVATLVLTGLRRTTAVNLILVGLSMTGILWFALSADGAAFGVLPIEPSATSVFAATAFLFVAYTGFGRVATLGEEVRDPVRVIPRAVVVTLLIAMVLYFAVALGGRAKGGPSWGSALDLFALDMPVVRVAAIAAMVGVLINLILGLSRVWLAMGRRRDMPERLARLDARNQPRVAIVLSAILVAATTLVGRFELAWSFSAMTVLLYYAITNLAALRLDRRRVTAWLGLLSCVVFSTQVALNVWLVGVGLIAAGMLWRLGRGRVDNRV